MTDRQWNEAQDRQLQQGLPALSQRLRDATVKEGDITDAAWDRIDSFLQARQGDLQEALTHYAKILLQWQEVFHLLGQQNNQDFVALHLLDSVSGALLLAGKGCFQQALLQIIDVGSGLGLPGLPLAIFLTLWEREHGGPKNRIFLVEPAARRANILRSMTAELSLQSTVQVCEHTVEEWSKMQGFADEQLREEKNARRIVTCRAFRPLDRKSRKQLLKPLQLLGTETRGILLYKGNRQTAQKELENQISRGPKTEESPSKRQLLKVRTITECFFELPQCSHQRSLFYLEL
ncbi:class I SAM-dependent methyltransferase [Candidatus Haliotispira prima]|uniref:Ribosomal RNA small subunit methyltransferase G n=1 Tax=Candidatus Haliotispira prima TaxID=3034016 RepID=A0ABY8MIC5_9SPIO|nr:class I SAM-dependent methyltransferase [Candidatus Haliotispira prima]